jgi:hypothetical protein
MIVKSAIIFLKKQLGLDFTVKHDAPCDKIPEKDNYRRHYF